MLYYNLHEADVKGGRTGLSVAVSEEDEEHLCPINTHSSVEDS